MPSKPAVEQHERPNSSASPAEPVPATTSDPLAPIRALSYEEKIALFT
jgi:hypothetical protein